MNARARLAVSLLFAATMGFFEAAVVVYLRRLWEMGQFDIATATLSNRLVLTEVLREAASLGMIASVALLAGRRAIERLGHAAVIFGLWDILYYAFLRLITGWPASVFDWDILFLIPRPWIGPVLAPVVVSAALLAAGVVVILREEAEAPLSPGALEWALGVAGGGIVIASFLIVAVPGSSSDLPAGFHWPLFLGGLATALGGFLRALLRPGRG